MSETRKLPAVDQRVETGSVQFGDDWPGVFIRGDNAFGYVMALDALAANPADPLAAAMVKGLRDALAGSDLTGLSRTAMNIPLPPTTLAAYCNPDDPYELETLHAIVRNWARQVAQKEAAAERERCAKLCDEWAQTCEWGCRHGAKVGSQECAKLIRMQEPT